MPSDAGAVRPLVLGFDTSAAQCAAALVSGDRVLARRLEPMARGQAERLLPMLEAVMAEAGRAWGDLDALAVCTGPGNFTGLRLGVAAARGLALALGVPAVGVTQFEARSRAEPRRRWIVVAAQGRLHRALAEAGAVVEGPVELADADAAAEAVPLDPAAVAGWAAARLAAGRVDPAARPQPFYLREADAAPSSEPPPRLLDDGT